MIYLDNAASTRPDRNVLDEVAQTAEHVFANPSSAHGLGAEAARCLAQARTRVAALIGAEDREIVFTSGGTEANALGLMGAAAASRGRHIVVSALEHPAVLRSADLLRQRGHEVTQVAPEKNGIVTAAAVRAALRSDTAVVAVMLVNNELGTLQPVAEIAAVVKTTLGRAHLHVDAVQAAGVMPLSVRMLGADSVALSAHKFHGPRGAGALWLSPRARVASFWGGGGQERGLRSGTENLPALAGMGVAAENARGHMAAASSAGGDHVAALRDRFEDLALAHLPHARPTIARDTPRAPHIFSLLVPGLPAEPLLNALQARGVYAAAGSACASRDHRQSHVLAAIGIREQDAVLRFSLSRYTQTSEIEQAVTALAAAVADVESALSGRQAAR